jgi:5S rRNA maturation endonuclease (ribonuclease M5)
VTNQFGTNAITGTSTTAVTNFNMSYISPTSTITPVTIQISGTSSENEYKFKTGLEYYQVITGMTAFDADLLAAGTKISNVPNPSLQNASSLDTTKLLRKYVLNKLQDIVYEDTNQTLRTEKINPLTVNGDGWKNMGILFLVRGVDVYSDKQDMVTVPVYSHTGVCVGFVARSVEGKAFKNSTGLPRSKVLFNLNNCKFQDIVVVESSFDAIRLWQLDIPAVATLGANVGTVQLALLNKYANTIIVAPDGDEAGNEMVSKLIRGLAGKDIRVMQIPEGKKDIGDMTDEEINNAYSQIKALDLALNI